MGSRFPRSQRRDLGHPSLVVGRRCWDLGHLPTRQKGSPIRVTTQRDGENHEVIPFHHPIKAGTLASILERVAAHHGMSVDELLAMLDL